MRYAGQGDVAEPGGSAKAEARAEPVRGAASKNADDQGILQSVVWPAGYRPPCPVCTAPTSGLRERDARVGRELVVLAVAEPCGCGVDDYAAVLQTGAPATNE